VSKLLPYIIVLLLVLAVAWITWDLKPPRYVEVPVHDTLTMPVDSVSIIKEATKGLIIGTHDELVKKYGKVIKKIITKDSLNIIDSVYWDTISYSIPTLALSDTFDYSGFDLLNNDTAKVSLRVRTDALALLEPINAIQIKTVIEDLTITVPQRPDPSSREIALKYWKELGAFGMFMFFLGVLR